MEDEMNEEDRMNMRRKDANEDEDANRGRRIV